MFKFFSAFFLLLKKWYQKCLTVKSCTKYACSLQGFEFTSHALLWSGKEGIKENSKSNIFSFEAAKSALNNGLLYYYNKDARQQLSHLIVGIIILIFIKAFPVLR